MKEICIPLERFDLDGFIYGTLNFLQTQVSGDPTSCITWVEAPGRCPNDEGNRGWDFRSKLLTKPVYLFFPFAIPDLEGSFDCADDQSYMDPWDDQNRSVGSEAEQEYEDEDSDEGPFFGDALVGYLIQVNEEMIHIASAICAMCGCCPPPTVDLLPNGGFLEIPLVTFINRFIKRG
jgi:hypothetical protein